jgi:dTDP-4-amino-4,6-dideoxygalactose transaminase
LAKWLLSRDIDARVYYPVPLHRQACFAALDEPALPASEQVCRTAIALPLFATMSDAQQAYVIDQVKAFFSS